MDLAEPQRPELLLRVLVEAQPMRLVQRVLPNGQRPRHDDVAVVPEPALGPLVAADKAAGLLNSLRLLRRLADTTDVLPGHQLTTTSIAALSTITSVGTGVSQLLPVIVMCVQAPVGSLLLVSDWWNATLADDPRWRYGTPPEGNANFAWVQHFIHHLSPRGTAGFVLANGSVSSKTSGEGEIRRKLVEGDLVDCIDELLESRDLRIGRGRSQSVRIDEQWSRGA